MRTNFADYMTKFDLNNDKPEKWYELQQRLLEPSWLLTHPRQWIDLVRQESARKIQIQAQGIAAVSNFSSDGGNNVDPQPIQIHQVILHLRMDPNMRHFPARDWTIVSQVMDRHMSSSPKISFKILGWVTMIA